MIDPQWTTAGSALAPASECPSPLAGVLGVPMFRASLTPGRCDLAPESIRTVMRRMASYDAETDVDLTGRPIADFGDLPVAGLRPDQALGAVSEAVAEIDAKCAKAVVILGGDNSVTRPALRGLVKRHRRCGLITLDAHHDVRSLEMGLHNGNPIRALIEDGIPGSDIIQIGIQSFANSAEYVRYARSAGIRFFSADDVHRHGAASLMAGALEQLEKSCDAVYVDLDLDVADRSFAPSPPGSRSGGLWPAQLFEAMRVAGAHPNVRALDVVEHDPSQDVRDVTAFLAASCVVRFLACSALHG
jgi:formiminoglutamase